jgi:hypothetical protein
MTARTEFLYSGVYCRGFIDPPLEIIRTFVLSYEQIEEQAHRFLYSGG